MSPLASQALNLAPPSYLGGSRYRRLSIAKEKDLFWWKAVLKNGIVVLSLISEETLHPKENLGVTTVSVSRLSSDRGSTEFVMSYFDRLQVVSDPF